MFIRQITGTGSSKNRTIFCLAGELNAQNSETTKELFEEAARNYNEIIVDCSELSAVRGQGVIAFQTLRTILNPTKTCWIVKPNEATVKVLKRNGLTALICEE